MTTRHDVSRVRLQGAYTAKLCPVRIQWDIVEPAEPSPVPEDAQYRMREGERFETEAFRAVEEAGPAAWHPIAADDPEEAIAATLNAMNERATLIAGGWLPADTEGRRTGKPDLLVWAGDGYVPVDVKHHRTLDVASEDSALVSGFDDPTPDAARQLTGYALRKRKEDALQLAHYRRMLEACGDAASTAMAGIIGTEGLVTWYDLEEPLWQTPAKSDGRKRKTRTSMEVYDFEFTFRLDIAAVALQHVDDPTVTLLVEPLRCGECPSCHWRDHCDAQLTQGAGDPSLLPGIGYRKWRPLRDQGITDRAGVAQLDYHTALLGAEGVDLARVLGLAEAADSGTPVADLIPRAKKQQELLTDAGIESVGDVIAQLDSATVALGGVSWLPGAILNARAVLGDAPVYRLPGAPDDPVERFDVEIDVDMENTPDGVYLWGVLVTDRAGTRLVDEGYRAFVSWEPLDDNVETTLFGRFWAWLRETVGSVEAAGHTVAAYCWYSGAENTEMRRLAAPEPVGLEEVEAFLASPTWIDLRRVFRDRWITGTTAGLKPIAELAGYAWPVDDPGGGISMVRHAEAIGDGPEGESARRWLLDYNRGDVEATRAVRDWVHREGRSWPELSTGEWG